MSQKFGLTYPTGSGLKKTAVKSSFEYFISSRTSGNDTDEWESEADRCYKDKTESIGKYAYIARLKQQNKKRFLKKPPNEKSQNVNRQRPFSQKYRACSEDRRSLGQNKEAVCLWHKDDNEKTNTRLSSGVSMSLNDLSRRSNDNEDWEKSRRKHIVDRFDKFSKGVLKLTGKLSSETINLIKSKIEENLRANSENHNARKSSKKKTLRFIKKILQGTSSHLPIYAPGTKKPPKKYTLVRQAQAPSLKSRSIIFPRLLDLKAMKEKKDYFTAPLRPNIIVSLSKQDQGFAPFCETVTLSNSSIQVLTREKFAAKFAKEFSCRLEDKLGFLSAAKPPIIHSSVFNFRQFSSKNLVNKLYRSVSTTEATTADQSEISQSTTVLSMKPPSVQNLF